MYHGARVRIIEPTHPAYGHVGTIARVCTGPCCWVKLARWPKGVDRHFSDERRNNIVVYDNEMREEPKRNAKIK